MALWRVPGSFCGGTDDFGTKGSKRGFFLLQDGMSKDFDSKKESRTSDILLGMVMITEYPLSVVFSNCSGNEYIVYFTFMAQAIASPIPLGYASAKLQRKRAGGFLPVLPDVGSITTLFPGISFPSASAASTIALAILSLTEPPTDVYSSFPTMDRGSVSTALPAFGFG